MRNPKDFRWPDAGERTELRDIAERWKWAYVDLAHDRHRMRVTGRRSPKSLKVAVEEYLAHREQAVEPRTFVNDRTAIKHLLAHAKANQPVHTIDLQAWADDMLRAGYKASTLDTYLLSMRGLWNWLGLDFPEVRLPDPGTQGVRFWTDEEVDALREAAQEMHPAVLRALDATLYMGLRGGEMAALRWSDIDMASWSVRVQRQLPQRSMTPKPLKGKKARTALILRPWQHTPGDGLVVTVDGGYVGRNTLWGWMDQLLRATGLNEPGISWHAGRHTYARLVLEGGGSLEQLQRFLGHASITTTEREYGWLRPGVAVEAARKVLHRG